MKPTFVRSLLDTSLLIYADAADEPAKQARAIEVITELRAGGKAVLSTQVLQEYLNVGLRKLRLPHALVRERLAFYSRFETVPASPELIAGALDLHVVHDLSFHDALIVRAAIVAGCQNLLSEDMRHGAVIGGVRIVNPFSGP